MQRSSSAAFFDGLSETVGKFASDNHWPVMAVVTTDGPSMNQIRFTEGKYAALLEQIRERAVTVHALGLSTLRGDGFQTRIVTTLAEMTGGWLDTLNSPSRSLLDKLEEMATEISARHTAASNQYLITYERPSGVDPNAPISAGVRRQGSVNRRDLVGRSPSAHRAIHVPID